jgi:hypothetical protein
MRLRAGRLPWPLARVGPRPVDAWAVGAGPARCGAGAIRGLPPPAGRRVGLEPSPELTALAEQLRAVDMPPASRVARADVLLGEGMRLKQTLGRTNLKAAALIYRGLMAGILATTLRRQRSLRRAWPWPAWWEILSMASGTISTYVDIPTAGRQPPVRLRR